MQQLYNYRLALDRSGHIGRGNRTSPCLTLEELEHSRALERFVGFGQQGRQGLGSAADIGKLTLVWTLLPG